MHPVSKRYVSARWVHKSCAETKCNIAVFITTVLQNYSGIPYNVSHLRGFFECIRYVKCAHKESRSSVIRLNFRWLVSISHTSTVDDHITYVLCCKTMRKYIEVKSAAKDSQPSMIWIKAWYSHQDGHLKLHFSPCKISGFHHEADENCSLYSM
jgi:hypothetical protein